MYMRGAGGLGAKTDFTPVEEKLCRYKIGVGDKRSKMLIYS